MKMVYLPYVLTSKERLEIIQSALKQLGYPKLLEIPLLNKVAGLRIVGGRGEGFITYKTKYLKELEIMQSQYGAYHIATFFLEGEYYFVTSLELKDGEII